MSDFAPSLQNAAAAGIPVTVAAYGDGNVGLHQSLEAMALKMREGRVDPAVVGWARGVLKAAGIDGRDGLHIKKWGSALLDAVRETVIYAPDAYGAEVISSAAATLCLRPGLCINGGDCDDVSVALGSALLSLGIPVAIIKQSFATDVQQHVLIAFQDETGEWIYADASTRAPLGSAPKAREEIWVDPMGPIGPIPEATAQIVTLGAAPPEDAVVFRGGHWWHAGVGGVSVFVNEMWISTNFKSTPSPVGVGTLFGYPTIIELVDLLKSATYDLQQLQAKADACAGWPNDPQGWEQWKSDLKTAQVALAAATATADPIIADYPDWAKPWQDLASAGAPNLWGDVTAVKDLTIDLDRRLRQAGACGAPTYANEPQPTKGSDIDLLAYQGADSVLKTAQSVADKALSPTALAVGGIVVGVVVAVGGILLLDKLLPSRR